MHRMVVRRKRPSPLNLANTQHCLEGVQSSPRMASFALSPKDKQQAIEQSKQIALRQRRLICSSAVTSKDRYLNSGGSSAESSSSLTGFCNNSVSFMTSSESCCKKDKGENAQIDNISQTSEESIPAGADKNPDDTSPEAADENHSIKIPKFETSQENENKKRDLTVNFGKEEEEEEEGNSPARKKPRRGEPPHPLRIPLRHKALLRQRQVISAPVNHADWQRSRQFLVNNASQKLSPSFVPVMPYQGMGPQTMYALPTIPIAKNRAPAQSIRVAGGFRSFVPEQASQAHPYSMIPIVSAHPPVAVRGTSDENHNAILETQDRNNTVDDVYAGSYRKKEQEKNGMKSDESETSSKKDEDEDDEDDLESRAIEEGAKAPPENLQGVIRIGERLYRYSVAITGDKTSDRKHFHDVMDVIWKNYAE